MEVFSPPAEIEKPVLDFSDIPAYEKAVEEYEQKIVDFCKQHGKGIHAGSKIKFPVADGYAMYVVFSLKPVELIHVESWDEYQFPYIQNLKSKDIVEKIEQEKAMSKLFAKFQ